MNEEVPFMQTESQSGVLVRHMLLSKCLYRQLSSMWTLRIYRQQEEVNITLVKLQCNKYRNC